jgi:autotransporter strand-loop-strand O-heptosyltransferase
MKTHKLLFNFASRSRPERLKNVIINLIDNLEDLVNFKILISIDDDDELTNNAFFLKSLIPHEYSNNIFIFSSPRKDKIDAINRDVNKISDWDILVNCSDDFEFILYGFDNLIRDKFNELYDDLDGCLHFSDDVHFDDLCTHSVIGKKYYERFNYVFYPKYKSFYCDNEFTEVAKQLEKITYIPFQFYNHLHYSLFSDILMDELYMTNEKFSEIDKELYFDRKKINFGINKNKMKITQVTPGLIPVPPNGWGAVEKIIWNYKLNFEEMGHECDVTYLNYVDTNSDIIHIHVANLAIEAKERGIPYIFSLHDHHVVRHGKNSGTYWENLEAIKGSIISFTHAEFLVDYFDETDKLFYLSHGVDTEYFSYTPKEITEHKLLCVANNGYRDNQSYDRKGFRFAIEAAKELGLPITIVGPKNNENFFNVNEDLLDYDRLTILSHNATEEELLQILKEHTIFLHPSELEAGHPNLTILESLSCGIPVVGTYNGSNKLKGLKRIERSTESVVDGIIDVMLKYNEYVKNTQEDKINYDWKIISKRLLKMFESIVLIKKEYSSDITKSLYIDSINSTEKNHIKPKEHVKFITHFVNGPFLEIQNNIDKEYYVEFIATDGSIAYSTKLRSNMWTRASRQYYEDWTINVYLDDEIVYTEKLNLKGSRVYIAIDSSALGDNLAWVPYIDEFRKKHNCHVICSTFKNDLFESQYPDIEFVNPGSEVNNILAMYMLGWFYDLNKEPTKPNIPSLQEHACNILGLDFTEIRPKLNMDISYRPISEKYITIGPTTTLGCKEWSYPNGWQELVDYLNGLGYKVAVITKEQTPWLNNVLDWTGDHPLQTRINQLYHSEFYIGLGSGLSWLSWSVGKPTVMIANFSKEGHEFTSNCIRITNKSVCNGCWNNPNFTFDKGDWYWCPVNKGTEDHFICQKSITPKMVIAQISHLL